MASHKRRIDEAIDTCNHVKELLPSFTVYMNDIIELLMLRNKPNFQRRKHKRKKRGKT